MFRLFEKPLLLVVVIALGAHAVVRIRDRSAPRRTRRLPMETEVIRNRLTLNTSCTRSLGSPVGPADVDYLDENGRPHRIDAAPLPGSFAQSVGRTRVG